MILPAPYPDELFYSIVARTADRMGLRSVFDINRYVFGIRKTRPSIIGLIRPDLLKERLLPGCPYTIDNIALNHTLVPYFAYFSSHYTVKDFVKHQIDTNKQANRRLANDTQDPLGLRFCRSCIREDYREGRELHWRRTHQLPGVNICHVHRCILTEGSTDLSNAHTIFLSLARLINECHPVSDLCVKAKYDIVEKLAIASHDFLIGSVSRSESTSRNLFSDLIAEAGWRHKGCASNITRTRLIEKIFEVYGPDILGDIGVSHAVYRPSFGMTSPRNSTDWLINCLNAKGRTAHPLPYLLIMLALKITTADLFSTKSSISTDTTTNELPTSTQDDRCLNPFCSRFMPSTKIREIPNAGKVSRVIECGECGYTYRTSGATGKIRFRRILSYGWVWDQALIEECTIGMCGYSEMQRKFGSCMANIRRRALQLNTWHPRWRMVEGCEAQAGQQRNWVAERTARIAEMRIIWLTAASINPKAGRMEISKQEKSAYRFLQRWDREWLDETTPALTTKGRLSYEFYPADADQALADRINEIAKRIINTAPRQRVTRRKIARELGNEVINFWVKGLAKSRRALVECVETEAEFRVRCLDGSESSAPPNVLISIE